MIKVPISGDSDLSLIFKKIDFPEFPITETLVQRSMKVQIMQLSCLKNLHRI